MRLATMILSLVLALLIWVQSFGVAVGGAGAGVIAGVLWVVGGALVLSRPGVSRWFYLAPVPILLLVGAGGYYDAYFWAVVSLILVAMAWAGIREREKKKAADQQAQEAQYQQWQR